MSEPDLDVEFDTVAPSMEGVGTELKVRNRVPLPLQVPDGGCTAAEIASFSPCDGGLEHVALLVGEWARSAAPLVRIHSECLTGDVFGSARCDCGPQLAQALALMRVQGGIVLYLRQEGRGIGLYNKIDAYELQDRGYDTFAANRALHFDADGRTFGIAAAMLRALGVEQCELLTNNPRKQRDIESGGIAVIRRRRTGLFRTPTNTSYLQAKAHLGAHDLDV